MIITDNIMKIIYKTLIIMAVAIFVCCGKEGSDAVDDTITQAEGAADSSNYVMAMEICGKIDMADTVAPYTERQLCRLATVYAVIADNVRENDAAMMNAVNILGRALDLNADSVNAFMKALPVEKQIALRTPLMLIHGRDADMSMFADGDSIFIQDHDIDPDAGHVHDEESHD